MAALRPLKSVVKTSPPGPYRAWARVMGPHARTNERGAELYLLWEWMGTVLLQ